ncbi:uncharacterized protein DUF1206 [Maribacter spongiicola]|uniref:Uncharacterized protein DUF1206 n=1 Tax=Maribacter spongiicola TaxID=1206753 RepID=A0A4R7K3D3_9FLAO|nr:DUF1206 domain-containing protein [Maribacter spongiicola]TDT45390.1 uncharacterized protein DUF1206 [Maribacter spongiicola]
MNNKIKNVALIGYTAKGVVYAMTGILTFLTSISMGGQKAGKLSTINFLEEQSFGASIVIILGLGLLCYALWRLIQGIVDPEDIGAEPKNIAKRAGFTISGFIYAGLGLIAIFDGLDIGLFSGSDNSKSSFLSGTSGAIIFLVIGTGLGLKGVYQFVKAFKGEFLDKFQIDSLSSITKRKYIKRIGYAGLISRGIVTSIISYFFITAGKNLQGIRSQELKGTSEAFSFIQEQIYGKWLLGIVAIGLVCYGLFMFSTAAYRKYDD